MKRLLILSISIISLQAPAKQMTFSCAGSFIQLLDSVSAAQINYQSDEYTRELSPFDFAIRLDKNPELLQQEDYLNKAAHEVHDWPADEREKLRTIFRQLDAAARSNGIHLHLPDTIKLIKTSGGEEFGAEGYTRGNRIMLNTAAQPIGLHIIAHELWHVISRLNSRLRNEAYAVFHFKACNDIIYKPALHNQVITNPDCPNLQHYVTIEKDGIKRDVVPILYSKLPYQKGFGGLMQYASIGLLVLSGDDTHKQPLRKDGQPVIFEMDETPGFFKEIGANTDYVLHAEEVAAEHFAALIAGEKLPQMEYLNGLKAVLAK